MKPSFEIAWTHEAQRHLHEIREYLSHHYSLKEVKKFFKILENKIGMVSKKPYNFIPSDLKKNVRKCVLSEQATLFFEVADKQVVVLAVFDDRVSRDSK